MKDMTDVTKLATRLSYLVAAVLVLLPFHAFLTTWAASNTGQIDLWRIWKELILAFVLVPAWLWLLWRSPQLRRQLAASWLFKLFMLYIFVQILLGGWALTTGRVNSEALIYGIGANLRFLVFFFICLAVAAHSGFLKKHWAKILLLPAMVVIGFGLLQKAVLPADFLKHFGYGDNTIPAIQTVDNNSEHRRIQSFLRGANPLGAYLVLVIAALMIRAKKSWFYGLGLAAALIVLFFSYSRSGWLGVIAAACLAGLLWANRKIRPKHILLLAASLVIIPVAAVYAMRDNDIVQNLVFHSSELSKSSQSSNAARLQSQETALREIIQQPLGSGPGTAGPASFRNSQPARISENYYLQIAQETGIIGLTIFLVINALIAWRLWRTRWDRLCQVLLISFAGLVFVNLVSHAWMDDTLAYLWWGFAGIALAPKTPAQQRSR